MLIKKEENLFEFDSTLAQVVIGGRRSGKSTLCHKVLLEHRVILECIAAKQRHHEVKVKIVSYHKYAQLPQTHEMAHEATRTIKQL